MYFDSHAHLDDARFAQDFDQIVARMQQNGVYRRFIEIREWDEGRCIAEA